jgi:hypothetical protein
VCVCARACVRAWLHWIYSPLGYNVSALKSLVLTANTCVCLKLCDVTECLASCISPSYKAQKNMK